MLDINIKEIIIQKLKELYLKQVYEEKMNNTNIYVQKKQCYLDLIKFFEENL